MIDVGIACELGLEAVHLRLRVGNRGVLRQREVDEERLRSEDGKNCCSTNFMPQSETPNIATVTPMVSQRQRMAPTRTRENAVMRRLGLS